MEKWPKHPALGLSAGSWKLDPLRSSKSTNLKSSSHFMCYKQCLVKLKMNTHTHISSMHIYTVYMPLVKSSTFVLWIIQRDSPLDPTVLTCGREHTFLRVIYERLQAQMWICRRGQPEGRQTSVYQREELKHAAPGETRHFHINSSVWTAL